MPSVIPVEGSAHPVFQRLNNSEIVDIYLTFDLSKRQEGFILRRILKSFGTAAEVMKPFQRWKAELAQDAPGSAVDHEFKRDCLNVVLGRVAEPSLLVDKLVEAYGTSELSLREILFIRRTIDDEGHRGEAIADPRMPQTEDPPDAVAFWRAVFDSTLPPPPTEDPAGMLSAVKFGDGRGGFELRAMPLYFTDVRIVYGTPKVDVLASDDRANLVAKALRENLDQRFNAGAPNFINHKGEENQVIRIGQNNRIGYSLAMRRSAPAIAPLVARYPSSFRYREYEVMLALRDTISSLDLEPVILWNRGDFYIFNLWEKEQ